MSSDPYQSCPCGSGKKLKFCCADLAEQMEKVHRHRENNQLRMALQALERIEKKHPRNAWVQIERAEIHMDNDEAELARIPLEQLLEQDPNHELGIALRAVAVFAADGFDAAKNFIYEAFLKCARSQSEILTGLALGMAYLMAGSQRHMAARQFLTLGMRLASGKQQQEIFSELLRFDNSRDHFYPLRSVHQLAPYSGAADLKSQADEAERLAELGCCEPAAEFFTRLGEEQPDCAVFWQNAGLCRAWAGDEESAADALHLAAQLHEEFETAVELETMAQLLDLSSTEDVLHRCQLEFQVRSASMLLSRLADHPKIVSLPLPPADDPAISDSERPIAFLRIIDRELVDGDSLTLETIPNVDLEVTIFDADRTGDRPARALLDGLESDRFDAARKLFEQTAGDSIEPSDSADDENLVKISAIPRQIAPLHWQWHIPPRTPGVLLQNLEREKWQQAIEGGWMNQPQDALRGKSPLAAIDDDELKMPLTAAVYALDALCDRFGHTLEIEAVCEQLGVAPLAPIASTAEMQLNALSSMQLNRLQVKELTDSQLNLTLNRALLLHYPRFLYEVLVEAVGRPSLADKIDRERAFITLSELSRAQHRRDEAISWGRRGAETEVDDELAFQHQALWKLRELSLRLDDPDDPELMPLLELLDSHFAPKLPGLREKMDQLCETCGIQAPWRDSSAVITSAAAASPIADGNAWQQEPETATGEKKLWLPGQS